MFLNREWVRQRLEVLKRYDDVLRECCDKPGDAWDMIALCAAERAMHMAIECTMDVANHVIDSFAMRDPSSYADIAAVMTEESIFPKDFSAHFMELVHFRKQLAHDYADLGRMEVQKMALAHRDDFREVDRCFRQYLRIQS